MSRKRISQSLLWITLAVSLYFLGAHSILLYFLVTTTGGLITTDTDSRWAMGFLYLFPLLATCVAFLLDRSSLRSRIGVVTGTSVCMFYAMVVAMLIVCQIKGISIFL